MSTAGGSYPAARWTLTLPALPETSMVHGLSVMEKSTLIILETLLPELKKDDL